MLMLLGPPSFIFHIVNYRDHMMEGAQNGSLVLVTPSGLMSVEFSPEVLKHMTVSKNNPAVGESGAGWTSGYVRPPLIFLL